jgi:hypothetical protein
MPNPPPLVDVLGYRVTPQYIGGSPFISRPDGQLVAVCAPCCYLVEWITPDGKGHRETRETAPSADEFHCVEVPGVDLEWGEEAGCYKIKRRKTISCRPC